MKVPGAGICFYGEKRFGSVFSCFRASIGIGCSPGVLRKRPSHHHTLPLRRILSLGRKFSTSANFSKSELSSFAISNTEMRSERTGIGDDNRFRAKRSRQKNCRRAGVWFGPDQAPCAWTVKAPSTTPKNVFFEQLQCPSLSWRRSIAATCLLHQLLQNPTDPLKDCLFPFFLNCIFLQLP